MIYWKFVLLTASNIVLNPQGLHSFSTTLPQQIRPQTKNVLTIRPNYLLPSITSLSSANSDNGYRSIGEVVGGLHGGKYQFGPGSNNIPSSNFAGSGSRCSSGDETEEDEEDMPNWAQRMAPPLSAAAISTTSGTSTLMDTIEAIEVPSNSNRSDGMVRKAMVSIKNDERTWEKYYAKIMPRVVDLSSIVSSVPTEKNDIPFRVTPRLGYLGPRGGARNACDASKPYSDSVVLSIIHQEGTATDIMDDNVVEWWLVAGTEEEKWYYKLKYCL